MAIELYKSLQRLGTAPKEASAFQAWLGLEDAFTFLEQDARSDWFTMYANAPHVFMNAVFAPSGKLTHPDPVDLLRWNFNACGSWGINQGWNPDRLWLSSPLDDSESEAMRDGAQIVFARSFEGRSGDHNYIEILQKFVHVLDLHFIAERNAYCSLDERGDLEEFIRVHKYERREDGFNGCAVEIRRTMLDRYAVLTDMRLVRMFDFTRFASFSSWEGPISNEVRSHGTIYYRLHRQESASFTRGVQIEGLRCAPEDALREACPLKDDENRAYESFVALDLKNDKIGEISTAPGATANYFTHSSLPFEMSPAFFRPEVLSKYKADPEKYSLSDRSISCRGAWSLQTYDINEAGQVHTYMVYLRRLPHHEQLHWKSHNEPPKGGISARAFKTDFEGDWDLEHDPLQSLKGHLADLHQLRVPWWTLRADNLPDRVHYPVTPSTQEWLDELTALDQFLIEGFEKNWWKREAMSLGYTMNNGEGSLRLIEECLIRSEIDNGKGVVEPFREVHRLRQLRGHAASDKKLAEARTAALAAHRTFKKHFEDLCRRCDEGLKVVVDFAGRRDGIRSGEKECHS